MKLFSSVQTRGLVRRSRGFRDGVRQPGGPAARRSPSQGDPSHALRAHGAPRHRRQRNLRAGQHQGARRRARPFGAGVQGLLFELADDETAEDINIRIRQAIENYEPRATVRSLKVQAYLDNNNVQITLEFQVRNTEEIVVLETTITRLR